MKEHLEVHLTSCYSWYCPGCDTKNYQDSVGVEMTDGEKESLYRHIHENESDVLPPDWECMIAQEIPTEVTCQKCKQTFQVAANPF